MNLDEIKEVLKEIQFNDWKINAHYESFTPRIYLQVEASGKCNVSGQPWNWKGRKWNLSRYMVKSEIVQTAFKAVMTAMEHEVREQFLYKGVSIFDPHYDVDKLVTLRRKSNCLDERKS